MDVMTDKVAFTLDPETCWQAVQARDDQYNGVFVYAVRSTGIYCKPSCSSRRPRREQVEFFASCESAEKAGYRACRRCYPCDDSIANDQVEIIHKACRLIEEASPGALSLQELSRAVHLSPSHFQRTFKAVTGLTPHQYAAAQRIQRFKETVRTGSDVTSALYEAGFSSSSRLYERASDHLGMTPASYRRGGRGMSIRYTIADTYLGRMLVAATAQGICAVSLGDDEAKLQEFLYSEYPAAEVQRDDNALGRWVNALVAHLDGQLPNLALPLDLQATVFRQRVWQELRNIPYGETRSYTDIARAIGQPRAVRAVANACASNPAILVNPCHRVIHKDGSLGGWRWGVERKQRLLEREKSGS
jgi:AraC family transcriptional regulator of adaptative response/methylated-DNA-[protein]-cysteine methyltransferase